MRTIGKLYWSIAAACIAALLAACAVPMDKPQVADESIHVGSSDFGGVVNSAKGPEAGVWVIAETNDLPTKFAKIVVTDGRGRYLMPDLPQASYNVWVRGYGLVDSPKVRTTPGKLLNLTAVTAPSAAAAAEYYPAIYWYSMLKIPAASEFPLGPVPTQGHWLNIVKTGACGSCHSLGTPGMRRMPEEFARMGNSVEAWRRRLQSGGALFFMARDINRLDGERALRLFADWTDRIAAGELPFAHPERPKGIERNLVITMWDWLRPEFYLHDLISTDRRDPTVNAGGLVYGSPEDSTDIVPVVDPRTHTAIEVMHPVRDPKTPSSKGNKMQPSPYWGPKPIWDSKTLNHNPMMDEKGRVWFTSRISPDANPNFCKSGSQHPSAKAFPLNGGANRHLSFYDPAKKEWKLIRTCFPTHHLNFARDANQTLWTSPGVVGPGVIGWLNRKMYEETGDEVRSQGWSPFIIDTNGNGRRDDYVEPDKPVDPAKDKRIAVNHYSVAISPVDGSIWGSVLGYPGAVVRVVPGSNPTQTALTEIYEPPLPGFGPRGGDIDLNGVFWVSLASGHLGSFDRRKCKEPLNGPKATGKHCAEGWTLHQFPGPQLRDVKEPGSAEASYYVWVDYHNILGLGRNVPIAMGNLSDSILPFVDGKFVTLRLPYPSGIFPKNVDGRIDDPNAGWKGKAIWTTSGSRTNFHLEGGKENRPKAVKLQLRPNPLAR